MPLLKGCCGMSLRTGVEVLGVAGVVGNLLLVVLTATHNVRFMQEGTMSTLGIVGALLCIVLSMLVIGGAVQGNRCLLVPWLIGVVATLIIAISIIIYIEVMSTEIKGPPAEFYAFSTVIAGASFYCWLVVLSLFQELRDRGNLDDEPEQKPPRPRPPAHSDV